MPEDSSSSDDDKKRAAQQAVAQQAAQASKENPPGPPNPLDVLSGRTVMTPAGPETAPAVAINPQGQIQPIQPTQPTQATQQTQASTAGQPINTSNPAAPSYPDVVANPSPSLNPPPAGNPFEGGFNLYAQAKPAEVAQKFAEAQNVIPPPVAPVTPNAPTAVQSAAEAYRNLPVDANPLERASAMNDYRQALKEQKMDNWRTQQGLPPTMADWQAQMAGPEHGSKLDQLREGGGKIDTENLARNMREDANARLGELQRALSDAHRAHDPAAAINARDAIIALKRDTKVGSYEGSLDKAMQKLMAQQDKGAAEENAQKAKQLVKKEEVEPTVAAPEKKKQEEGDEEEEVRRLVRLRAKPRARDKYASRR